MAVREVPAGPPEAFLGAVAALRAAMQRDLRPEVRIEEVPAPQRIAPYAMALSADVVSDDDELATGRFIVLHDPACPQAWDGPFRIVSYVRAAMESELAADPVLGQVGWSWLQEALETVTATAVGGTVTRVVSETFGELAGPPATVELEIRASWTPTSASRGPAVADDWQLGAHLVAWAALLCTIGGLPPLPPGVSALPRLR